MVDSSPVLPKGGSINDLITSHLALVKYTSLDLAVVFCAAAEKEH